jgi:lipoprotein-anchoring transpeptidase ErfK/SrfK
MSLATFICRFVLAAAVVLTALPAPASAASRYAQADSFAPARSSILRGRPVPARYKRQIVRFRTAERPGTIIIDTGQHFLYYVLRGGRAVRYGIGVGRQGFSWSGVATINSKQEWPDWYPPKEMLARQANLRSRMSVLQGGLGMPGGPGNPLGARAMYLWQNGKDTLYRIHGTREPWTIGQNVSSGCIRMRNEDVIDLFKRVEIGAKVVVL